MKDISKKISELLKNNKKVLVTAESCTGGWVAKVITDLAGSSAYFDRGFVTYSNQAKQDMLGVKAVTLDEFGAVSEQVAIEMVDGALQNSAANIAISISGIAGPGGGTAEKPVGTVCFAWKLKDAKAEAATQYFVGDRDEVRRQAVEYSLNGILKRING